MVDHTTGRQIVEMTLKKDKNSKSTFSLSKRSKILKKNKSTYALRIGNSKKFTEILKKRVHFKYNESLFSHRNVISTVEFLI